MIAGGWSLTRDEQGRLHAAQIQERPTYQSQLRCTDLPVPLRPALEDPEMSVGGLLWGPTGVGKSYRGGRRVGFSINARHSARFLAFTGYLKLLQEIQLDHNDERHVYVDALRESVQFLVVDDLGAEKLTDFARQEINYLLERREANGLGTLVTSNLSPAQIAAAAGDRVMSKILGFGPEKHMEGLDRRWMKP